ncbi:uncharacterized protein LOC113312835 [Papaver somniferum]|uniref:uncharacterized protein LOC113312835 n=1 Tax=Papaver somniferum TaxID=3469 RepID=UPI000E7000C9|nr:uncharacterized protein LOC113312835 [Papaver somniferum]
MRKLNMKINPAKCIFGVSSGKFLGYIFSEKGIEVDPIKVQAVRYMPCPSTIKDVQKLNGQLAALGRFIVRSSDRCKHFFDVLNKRSKFEWTEECDGTLKSIKDHLANLSILQKPEPGEELLIYLAAISNALNVILLRSDKGIEKPISYISKIFNSAEINYTKIEKLILALVYATQKLRTYFQAHKIKVLTRTQIESVLKHTQRVGRVAKWNAQTKHYVVKYEILSSPKSQVIADFLAEFPLEEEEDEEKMIEIDDEQSDTHDLLKETNTTRWEIFVDGSTNSQGRGIGIVFTSPGVARIVFSFRIEFQSTNNTTEYEALVHALRLAEEMKLEDIRLTSDSQLVISQIKGKHNASDPIMQKYLKVVKQHAMKILKIVWRHIGQKDNWYADALAFISSMTVDPSVEYVFVRLKNPSIEMEEQNEESLKEQSEENIEIENEDMKVMNLEMKKGTKESEEDDWRKPIYEYLERGELPRDRLEANKIKSRSTKYELREGILYRRYFLGPLLRCLSLKECMEILKAIHYGDAVNHSGTKSQAYKAKDMDTSGQGCTRTQGR